ncbi:MAG: hypothetical protein ACI90V_010128 [Bacillariaceae sp.]|jgi:hypothetical protein
MSTSITVLLCLKNEASEYTPGEREKVALGV